MIDERRCQQCEHYVPRSTSVPCRFVPPAAAEWCPYRPMSELWRERIEAIKAHSRMCCERR